jgi:hypothetical protein
MIGKKFIALLIVGGLTASIGVTAGAYTKNVSTKAKINYTQTNKQGKPMNGQLGMKTQLDTLVKAGTITQATEDKVVTYFNQKDTAQKAEMAKIKSMTAAERKTYLESKVKVARTDLFADMVSSGTLTQAEADALKAALPQGHGQMGFEGQGRGQGKGNRQGFGTGNPADMQKNMKTKLDAAVKAGTITQAIEDKVIASFTQLEADKKAEMDKVKSMTEADRKAYFDSKVKGQKPTDPLASLVTNGTLTQAQSDAIKQLLPGGPGGHGGPGGFRGRH